MANTLLSTEINGHLIEILHPADREFITVEYEQHSNGFYGYPITKREYTTSRRAIERYKELVELYS